MFALFGNRESGHTYKVRLMLALAGIAHDYTEIDLGLARDTRPEPFRTLAKYGEVPLLLHDGTGRAFILGDLPSVADISLCGYMFWPEQAGVVLPFRVTAWLERISALPGWCHPYDMHGQ